MPDQLAIKIAEWAFDTFLKKALHPDQYYNRPFIVVGYPHTEPQVRHFQSILERNHIYALIAVLEVKPAESIRRMKQSTVARIGHSVDIRPEVQKRKIGEYYLRSHGLIKWLIFTGKATLFKTCIDRFEYEKRKHELLSIGVEMV